MVKLKEPCWHGDCLEKCFAKGLCKRHYHRIRERSRKEYHKNYHKGYYEKNKERIKENTKEYKNNNKSRVKKWSDKYYNKKREEEAKRIDSKTKEAIQKLSVWLMRKKYPIKRIKCKIARRYKVPFILIDNIIEKEVIK